MGRGIGKLRHSEFQDELYRPLKSEQWLTDSEELDYSSASLGKAASYEPKGLYKFGGCVLRSNTLSSVYHHRCPLCPLCAFLWANAGPSLRRATA
jgi:hypothetical protein